MQPAVCSCVWVGTGLPPPWPHSGRSEGGAQARHKCTHALAPEHVHPVSTHVCTLTCKPGVGRSSHPGWTFLATGEPVSFLPAPRALVTCKCTQPCPPTWRQEVGPWGCQFRCKLGFCLSKIHFLPAWTCSGPSNDSHLAGGWWESSVRTGCGAGVLVSLCCTPQPVFLVPSRSARPLPPTPHLPARICSSPKHTS